MTIKDELIQYSRDCLSGKIVSCEKHKWACQRFLDDVERAKEPDPPFVWNEREAQKIVDWFALLRHSKGVLSGKPIELTTWQKFRECQLYGWRTPDGYKRFNKAFTEVARKNGKSQIEAGEALYGISVESAAMHEVHEEYTAGTKREQSKIVFDECDLMTRGSPIRTKFRFTRTQVRHVKSGSFIKPLSKQDGKNGDGTNPYLLVLDEYHQHPTTDFYDLGLGSNTKGSMLSIITTAGKDLRYPCYTQEYLYCSRVLDPAVDIHNDEYFIDIMEADKDDDPGDVNTWRKANPIRASYPEGLKKIQEEYDLAKQVPEKMTAFLTKMLDVWVQAQENGYMDMGKWKACEVSEIPFDTKGWPVYVGFDMSAKIDLTSVSFILPHQTEEKDSAGHPVVKYILYSHSFIPNRAKLTERKAIDKFDYDMCERLGYLSVTDSPIVDQSFVMRYVLETCEKHDWQIQCLAFDPANASKIMMDLSNEGYDVEEVYQSHKSLNEATQGFREQVYSGNVVYTYNPLLNFAMSNAVIRTNDGLIKIDKDSSIRRIDPVDATLCAFKLAMFHDFDDVSRLEAIDKFLQSDW